MLSTTLLTRLASSRLGPFLTRPFSSSAHPQLGLFPGHEFPSSATSSSASSLVRSFPARSHLARPLSWAVKVGDTIDVKLIEINGKGQLRLSPRALLSDSNTENSDTKQRSVDLSEESTEKGKQNIVTGAVEVENAELSNETSVDIEVRRSCKSKPVVANSLMEDKFVKKLVSSGKNALESDSNRPKKSSDKPAISIYSKNEILVVNGEAKSR